MKAKLTSLILALVAVFAATQAQAISIATVDYRDVDIIRTTIDAQNQQASGEFNLVTGDGDLLDWSGFNPAGETVVEAMVGFIFVELDNGSLASFTNATFNIGAYITSGIAGGPAFDPILGDYEISINTVAYGVLGGSLLVDIQEDGIVNWSVSLSASDVTAGNSILLNTVYLGANVVSNPVPDSGATAGLFTMAAISLLAVSRRIRR